VSGAVAGMFAEQAVQGVDQISRRRLLGDANNRAYTQN
jgi:hypothetical protein